MTERSDHELAEAWRAGDKKAGSELFDRHFDALYRFFAGKVGEAADDLVQQTLTACIRGGQGWRGDASFRAYLFAIARHELFRWFEKRQRDATPCDFDQLSVLDLGTSPSAVVARQDDERVLLHALRRLPLEQQIVVELYFFERLRGRDLIAALGIPEGTVRSRLRLALERLRREIEAVERSPDVLTSTLTTLDGWANALKGDEFAG